MRPLHVLDMSLPHVAGYTSRARSILEAQRALGMSPLALTGLRQPPGEAPVDEIGGIAYHRTPEPSPPAGADLFRRASRLPGLREGIEMTALARRASSLARQEGADVLHAHSPVLCGIPAHVAARRAGIPSVYEIRAFWEDAAVNLGRDAEGSARYAAIRRLETALVHRVDGLVVLCEGIKRDLEARGVDPSRIVTVPNGVDGERFEPAERDPELARKLGFEGKTVVGYVGTFFRFEGLSLLLRALDRLTRENDSVRGMIVGHGETEGEMQALAKELGLGDRVKLVGKVPPADVRRYYGLTDVLCYPRERHRITELTTPLKPLEALAMQKAIVVSDVGGLLELVVPDETALTFKAGDEADLVRVLRAAIADPARREALGEAGRRDVLENRSWKALATRYEAVYEAARARLRASSPRVPLATSSPA